jgi:1-acyl-sn-glycerol-3-phosphate acyltransferase
MADVPFVATAEAFLPEVGRTMRLAWRALALVVLLIAGLLIAASVYRWVSLASQNAIRQRWSKLLLCICGIRLNITGTEHTLWVSRPSLVVMNHVSWLDIFALNAVLPVTFVAKSEIRHWPLVGWLVSGTRTIFIERGNRHAVRAVNHEMLRRIEAGEHVAFFPEGTTTDGFGVLPFHTSLFSIALDHPIDILPVTLRYSQHERFSSIPAYTGEQTLVNSMVSILSSQGLAVTLQVHECIGHPSGALTRHELAEMAFRSIQSSFEAASRLD